MPMRKFRLPLRFPHLLPLIDRPSKAGLRQLWRSGLLVATSAALGGIAVAIWSRRTLAQIREQAPPTNE